MKIKNRPLNSASNKTACFENFWKQNFVHAEKRRDFRKIHFLKQKTMAEQVEANRIQNEKCLFRVLQNSLDFAPILTGSMSALRFSKPLRTARARFQKSLRVARARFPTCTNFSYNTQIELC